MNLREIKELIDTLIEKDITEFELERGNEKIRIRRGTPDGAAPMTLTPVAAAPAVAGPAAAPPAAVEAQPTVPEELHLVKSPIVGTFYEASSPGAPPFVQIGDTVEAGQVLCIIEAMKLMNEIESDVAGVVEKRFVSNQQPVEYGEALFGIRKR
jgi:acetyl-CoA carboxylase biotin carboxyl carrier protein